jgi:hypothetical protein
MLRVILVSSTDQSLLSPWQTIPSSVVYLTAGSLFLLGSLIAFSRFPAWLLVVLISLQTLIMHSYLPLSHEFFYGADGWRHIASVERIIAGLPLTDAATITSGRTWLQYLNPGVVAYSHLWGLMLLMHVFGISFIKSIAWLVPVLWSLVVPVTLFKLGKELGWADRAALVFSFATLIPFALVAGGSFTLPNSLGFIVFLPSLIFVVRRLKTGEKRWMKSLLVYGLFLLTGYTLYAVVFWMMWGIGEALLYLSLRAERSNLSGLSTSNTSSTCTNPTRLLRRSSRFGSGLSPRNDTLVTAFLLVVCIFSLPTLELVSGYSQLPTSLNMVFFGIKQFVGNLSGFYLANGPRPHTIATGNILLYQTPSYAFVPNFLTDGRYWLVVLSCCFWLLTLLAVVRGFRSGQVVERWLALLTLGLFGSYFVGRYVLGGEQILSRRLDMLLALSSLLIVFTDGVKRLAALSAFSWYRWYVLAILVVVSTFGAAVYSLGPTDRALSADEYHAAEYVWQVEKNNGSGHYCVIADTYPLLALEALSAKRIVGGGFPIDQYFGQREREEIFQALEGDFSTTTWQRAQSVTGAKECWFIGTLKKRNPVGDFVGMFGGLGVWEYSQKDDSRN